MTGALDQRALSELPITYIDGLHDNWPHAPAFFAHL
jgi:hypothetical protein